MSRALQPEDNGTDTREATVVEDVERLLREGAKERQQMGERLQGSVNPGSMGDATRPAWYLEAIQLAADRKAREDALYEERKRKDRERLVVAFRQALAKVTGLSETRLALTQVNEVSDPNWKLEAVVDGVTFAAAGESRYGRVAVLWSCGECGRELLSHEIEDQIGLGDWLYHMEQGERPSHGCGRYEGDRNYTQEPTREPIQPQAPRWTPGEALLVNAIRTLLGEAEAARES